MKWQCMLRRKFILLLEINTVKKGYKIRSKASSAKFAPAIIRYEKKKLFLSPQMITTEAKEPDTQVGKMQLRFWSSARYIYYFTAFFFQDGYKL